MVSLASQGPPQGPLQSPASSSAFWKSLVSKGSSPPTLRSQHSGESSGTLFLAPSPLPLLLSASLYLQYFSGCLCHPIFLLPLLFFSPSLKKKKLSHCIPAGLCLSPLPRWEWDLSDSLSVSARLCISFSLCTQYCSVAANRIHSSQCK